jgi:WD40 repeat protein
VRVWDVKDKIQICEFGGHKFSIECVCFTNNNLIVSIGSIHDMVVNVWNLKSKFKVASNKIACKIKGIAFSRDSSFFVTVGNRHVKYWYLTVSSLMETVPLKGRAAILSDMRNMNFCDVVCGTGDCIYSTYTITTNGILCEFNNEQRCINRSIDLPSTEHAYCIYADNRENLFIGCSNGTILIFRQKTLEIITSLPRPHSLGIDLSITTTTSPMSNNKYPDCIALCFDNNEFILSSIYNDHSFYVWDIKDLNKVKKLDSHLFHSSCCWSLDTYSSVFNNNNSISSSSNLPIDTFITCSSDNTVRIWSNTANNNYSKELLKIIYIDNDLSALCEIGDSLNSDSSSNTTEQCPTTTTTTTTNTTTTSCPTSTNTINNESKMGARCLKISPYGKHLATGDRNGNIRITDLQTLESIALIEAHDGEVLYLQYSQPEYTSRLLLASSSRDRLIHIFDASRSTYDLLQTLDDHSAAITAVRFCFNQYEKQLYIISCGADKSIMFRTLIEQQQQQQQQQQSSLSSLSSITSSGIGGGCSSTSSSSSSSPNFNNTTNSNNNSSSSFQFVRTSYVAEKQTFYDLNSDPSRNFIYTISQDRIIRTYSIKDGKKLRQFRGSLNEDGYLIKMDIDKTGQLLATSCTDKCVYIWDINTTECIAYLCGHSEVVYDLKFTHDNKHLITVSADGCIFMWRLNNLLNNNNELTSTTRKLSSSSSCSNTNTITSTSTSLIQNQLSLDDIFSDSENEQLPAWARNKLSTISTSTSIDNEQQQQQQQQPKRVRAVWGPVSDTSFSFMVDTENQSIINQSSLNSFLVDDDEDSNEQEVEIVEEEEEEEESIQTTIIQNNEDDDDEDNDENNLISFPKPKNDTKLDTSSTSTSSSSSSTSSSSTTSNNNNNSTKTTIATVRKSWVCSNKEQDLLFSLLNSTNDSNKELSNFESLALEEQSPSTSLSTSQNNNNSSIKLDCDLENSFRRQSLSARYLMRAQQNTPTTTTPTSSLLNKSYDDMKPPISPNFSSPTSSTSSSSSSSSSSTSTASSTHSSPSLKKIQSPITTTSTPIDVDESLKECENNTNLELIIKSDKQQQQTQQKEQININQMTADLVKMRKKAAQLNTNNNNINKMHSQHTESSLNKTKPKQQQLKRSPSVNSINNDNNNKNGLLGDSSASSSSSSIKNVKTKMISKQISVISTTNTNNHTDDTNLKKAASMVSLIATTNKQHILNNNNNNNNNNTKQLIKNSHQQLSTQNNQLLPPKTVRQVKQRSAERQLTILPLTATTTTTNLKSNITVANTFNEQNKHLRKLSSSIQNLHNEITTITPAVAAAATTTTSVTNTNKTGVVTAAVNAFNKLNITTTTATTTTSPIKLKQTSTSSSLISSSSSSSSCSLFDNVSSISSSSNSNTVSNELNTVIESTPSTPTSSLIKPKTIGCFTNTTSSSSSSSSNIGITISSNDSGLKNILNSRFNDVQTLKKPITFASIAAAANSGINNALPITSSSTTTITTTNTTSPICSPKLTTSKFTTYSNTSPLTINKIETIIDDFKKNIYILQLVSNQSNKITDDLTKSSINTNNNNNNNNNNQIQATTQASQQTIQLMQTFNTTVQSLVLKFNSSLNAIKVSQQISSSSSSSAINNSELTTNNSKDNNDIEIS